MCIYLNLMILIKIIRGFISAEHLKPSSSGDEAKVIPFNAVEADDQEDYSLPTYVPELFQDPPEKDES